MFEVIKLIMKRKPLNFYSTCLCYFFMGILPIVEILAVKKILDNVSTNKSIYLSLSIVLVLILQQILLGFVKELITYFLLDIKYLAEEELSNEFYNKCLRLEYSNLEDSECTKNMRIVKANFTQMFLKAISGFGFIFSNIFSIVGIFIIISKAGWTTIFTAIITLVPVCIASVIFSKKEMNAWDNSGYKWRRTCYLSDLLKSRQFIKESKIYNTQKFIGEKWSKSFNEYHNGLLKMTATTRIIKALFIFLQCASIGLMIYMMLSSLKNHSITIGTFVAVINGLYQLTNSFGWNMACAIQNCAYVNKVFKIYENVMLKEEVIDTFNEEEWTNVYKTILENPTLVVKDVWFRYNNQSDYVLKGVTFKIEGGKKTALVGKNGAGKSTLIKLILGYYKPEKGEITLGGYSVEKIPHQYKKMVFSAVFQDYARYEITLGENLTLHDLDKKDDISYMDNALQCVGGQYIHHQVGSYNIPLGKRLDNGVDISNGQWQRVVIARAVAKKFSFIILDEPTAAQDPKSEVNLYKEFNKITKGKSGLFITHRLGAISYLDNIIVLLDGRIAEQGTHKQLLKEGGLYAEMFEAQKGWYK